MFARKKERERERDWDNTTLYTKFDTGFSKKQFL
jgi:hypothetical protein